MRRAIYTIFSLRPLRCNCGINGFGRYGFSEFLLISPKRLWPHIVPIEIFAHLRRRHTGFSIGGLGQSCRTLAGLDFLENVFRRWLLRWSGLYSFSHKIKNSSKLYRVRIGYWSPKPLTLSDPRIKSLQSSSQQYPSSRSLVVGERTIFSEVLLSAVCLLVPMRRRSRFSLFRWHIQLSGQLNMIFWVTVSMYRVSSLNCFSLPCTWSILSRTGLSAFSRQQRKITIYRLISQFSVGFRWMYWKH